MLVILISRVDLCGSAAVRTLPDVLVELNFRNCFAISLADSICEHPMCRPIKYQHGEETISLISTMYFNLIVSNSTFFQNTFCSQSLIEIYAGKFYSFLIRFYTYTNIITSNLLKICISAVLFLSLIDFAGDISV